MNKREGERYRPQATYLDWAGPPGPCQSPPTFASRQRRGTAHRRRARARATSCFPGPSWRCHDDAPKLLAPLPHSLLSPSPSAPSPEHTRAELVDAARRSHGHRPPLAPPMSPRAPPRRLEAPPQREHRRTPCRLAIDPSSPRTAVHRRRQIPTPSVPPRARREPLRDRGEPPVISP